ncbi:hypothetical protein PBAC_28080 [Pedobacter glucosidilyticus]|nr:hypothetical protein PBAC_28080 [Pedobacter glucosidilyticus]
MSSDLYLNSNQFKIKLMQKILFYLLMLTSVLSFAQEDTTEVVDYGKFGDAEGVKRYCNQKVINQLPQRIISFGYEHQGGFTMPGVRASASSSTVQDFTVNQVSSLRAQVNIPVISNTKIIWQVGANYWASRFNLDNPGNNSFAQALDSRALTTTGINTTIFKPLNEKNFLIFQASADANGLFNSFSDISSDAITISGAAIYGWKTSDRNMIGTGISRTYRAGQLLHVPVLFWNRSFNDRWGMELLLPARGHVKYNFSTSNILQVGFELEGNQFLVNLPNSQNGKVFLQRGELKPRVAWDKKLTGFLWMSAQAGYRHNWRFDVMNGYDARETSQRYFSSNLGNPFYFNLSLNLVSP